MSKALYRPHLPLLRIHGQEITSHTISHNSSAFRTSLACLRLHVLKNFQGFLPKSYASKASTCLKTALPGFHLFTQKSCFEYFQCPKTSPLGLLTHQIFHTVLHQCLAYNLPSTYKVDTHIGNIGKPNLTFYHASKHVDRSPWLGI